MTSESRVISSVMAVAIASAYIISRGISPPLLSVDVFGGFFGSWERAGQGELNGFFQLRANGLLDALGGGLGQNSFALQFFAEQQDRISGPCRGVFGLLAIGFDGFVLRELRGHGRHGDGVAVGAETVKFRFD